MRFNIFKFYLLNLILYRFNLYYSHALFED